MKKSSFKFILAIMFILVFIFTTNVSAADISVSNLDELETKVLEQLKLLNSDFNLKYTGTLDGLDDTFRNLLKEDHLLRCSITSIEWATSGYENKYDITVKAEHILTHNENNEVNNKIDIVLKSIIKPYMNDHEKVKAVHDWIILNGQYDTSYQAYSDYDLLIDGKSVCNGYALLTYKMLTKLDIPVDFVFGSSKSIPHVWNIVKLGDYWFHLDTTWDDPVPDRKDMISYDYYMLTTDEIAKSHTIENVASLPKSDMVYYDYLNKLSTSLSSNSYTYKYLITELGLDIYYAENSANTLDSLNTLLKHEIISRPSKISIRYNKNISEKEVISSMSSLLSNEYISDISYDPILIDKTGNYNILSMYINYKKTPDKIITDFSDKVYNTASTVNFNVYAVYGNNKEDITDKVFIYPYNTNFIKLSGKTLTFNDAGSQTLKLSYEGCSTTVNITAVNSKGFEYITDTKPSDGINVKVFDKYIDFNKINQKPMIDNKRTLVPLRAIFEVLNCNVDWEEATMTAIVQKGNIKIKITSGSSTAYINGREYKLDVPAKIVNGRIMVPLRFISESIERIVIWDGDSNTVLIY